MSQAASRGVQSNDLSKAVSSPIEGSRLQKDDLAAVYLPVSKELAAVDELLTSELQSETPWVDQLLEHNWINGGKRIRPLFLLLSGASCGELTDGHTHLAAAVEMIHAATLVHDDVLDKAETRRHQPTVNARWDNRISVLLGDYLFTHAFHVAASSLSAEAVKILAASSNKVCEGEMHQNAWQGKFDLSEEDYLKMISYKTAELCRCSCRLGALMSGADSETVEAFGKFGQDLGVAFQIIDDVLDLVGQQNKVGKTLGTDLLNQKTTLPIIHCLDNSSESEQQELLTLLSSNDCGVEQVMPHLLRTQSIEYTRSTAQKHAKSAFDFSDGLEANSYSTAMRHLASFVLKRTH